MNELRLSGMNITFDEQTYRFFVAVEYDPTNEHRFVCCMYRNVFEFESIDSEDSLNIVDELDSMLDHHQTDDYIETKQQKKH